MKTGTALVEIEKHPAVYTGSGVLEGAPLNSEGLVEGNYWIEDGTCFFQVGTLVFEVSDEDLRRIPISN